MQPDRGHSHFGLRIAATIGFVGFTLFQLLDANYLAAGVTVAVFVVALAVILLMRLHERRKKPDLSSQS